MANNVKKKLNNKEEVPCSKWKKYKESTTKAQKAYVQNTVKCYNVRFNKTTDADIIEHITAQGEVIPYFKRIIREDIKKNKTDLDDVIE
jgi:hypothetical protein